MEFDYFYAAFQRRGFMRPFTQPLHDGRGCADLVTDVRIR